jgi:hypothetical protein
MPRKGAARQPLCADIDGFSLHAAVRVDAHERKRLQQLCRYITRPALSDERVQLNAAGQVELKLKTPWRSTAAHGAGARAWAASSWLSRIHRQLQAARGPQRWARDQGPGRRWASGGYDAPGIRVNPESEAANPERTGTWT